MALWTQTKEMLGLVASMVCVATVHFVSHRPVCGKKNRAG
jgi:hypothetical protein